MNELPTYVVEPKGDLWIVREPSDGKSTVFEGPFNAAWAHAIALGQKVGRVRVRAVNRDGEAIAQEET